MVKNRYKRRVCPKWEDSVRTVSNNFVIWSLGSRKQGQLPSIYYYTGAVPTMGLSTNVGDKNYLATTSHQALLGLGLLASV